MKNILVLVLCLFTSALFAQNVPLEGYVFEKGNRGYLNVVRVLAEKAGTNQIVGEAFSNVDGFFTMDVPANSALKLYFTKDMFESGQQDINVGASKTFVKIEMERSPGYLFEITLAEKRISQDTPVDAIKGARIEVYNNTTKESVMDLIDHPDPEFKINLEKGNHYTILVRKNGFLSKRMEAKVNVEGCILCFEGIGSVRPGVVDNLTEGNDYGVLLANVGMERIFEGKTMEVQNLLYDLGKWNLKPAGRQEMQKVITLMKDNPNLTLQLGSHTDSRGGAEHNLELSKKRAKAAVDYLIDRGGINKQRISHYGFGEQYPLNECVDGVRCSEAQHAKNRRTELKIVGITNLAEVKSLYQMKKSVEMEGMIGDLMDQDQVRASNEEELKKKVEELENEKKMEQEVEKEDAQARIERERNALLERKKKMQEERTTTTKSGRDKIEMPEAEAQLHKTNTDMPGLDTGEEGGLKTSTNGVKIILVNARMPIMKTHKIYKDFDNIEIHRTGDARLYYMIGGYETVSDAVMDYNKNVSTKYPTAFLASFKNGKMTIVNQ